MANQTAKVKITWFDEGSASRVKASSALTGDIVEGGVILLTGTRNVFDQPTSTIAHTNAVLLIAASPVTVGQSNGTADLAGLPDPTLITGYKRCRVKNVTGTAWAPNKAIAFDATGNIRVTDFAAVSVVIGYTVSSFEGVIDIGTPPRIGAT